MKCVTVFFYKLFINLIHKDLLYKRDSWFPTSFSITSPICKTEIRTFKEDVSIKPTLLKMTYESQYLSNHLTLNLNPRKDASEGYYKHDKQFIFLRVFENH